MSLLAGLRLVLWRTLTWPLTWYFRPRDVLPGLQEPTRRWWEVLGAALGGGVWGAFATVPWSWALGAGAVSSAALLVAGGLGAVIAVANAFAVTGARAAARAVTVARAVARPVSVVRAVARVVAHAYAFAFALAIVVGGAVTVAGYFAIVVAGPFADAEAIVDAFRVLACVCAIAGAGAYAVAVTEAIAVAGAGAYAVAEAVAEAVAVAVAVAVAHAYAYAVAGSNVGHPQFLVAYAAIQTAYSMSRVSSLVRARAGLEHAAGASDPLVLERGPKGATWLFALWLGTLVLALFLSGSPSLVEKPIWMEFDGHYAYLPLFAAAFATGLPFLPIVAWIQWWQCRSSQARHYEPTQLGAFIASRWQSFMYPLPGIRRYLREVGKYHGPVVALQAIQELQRSTLQSGVTSRATLDLSRDSRLGVAFAGHAATETNHPTLVSLGLRSPAAAVLAVLAGAARQSATEPDPARWVQLDLRQLPRNTILPQILWSRRRQRYHKLLERAAEPLDRRIPWLLEELSRHAEGPDALELQHWLETVNAHLRVSSVAEYEPLVRANPASARDSVPAWLRPAWQVIVQIEQPLKRLERYPLARSADARRYVLEHVLDGLRESQPADLPWLWESTWHELRAHWLALLEQERKQAREWLNLELDLPAQKLRVGRSALRVVLQNPTRVVAKELLAEFEPTEGLHWGAPTLHEPLLEGGQSLELTVPFTCDAPGDYAVGGQLRATDLSEVPFSKAFSFRVHVGKLGRPYQRLPTATYPAGPGVNSDSVFAGRHEVLRWLAGIWGTPSSKEAAVLIGQRRIGKSSILFRIERQGLEGTSLIPVRVDVQGTQGPYGFLVEAALQLTTAAGLSAPKLDRDEPLPDFKSFVRGLKGTLGERRILLMLDEADLLEQRVGESVLGLLRSLMQDPSYPLVLLFCGTHQLRRMKQDYQSILFNTTREYAVSYMSAAESAEVLRRPVGDALEYDEAAVREAYRLTAGQPYLLQLLGVEILEHLNLELDQGKTPDSFVDLQDMERAAERVGKRDNAAYTQYWSDRSPEERRILSALASVPETIRLARTVDELARLLGELGMALPRPDLVRALEALVEQEFLAREEGQYEFRVPLFRRWVAAKHKPEIVRELTAEPQGG